MKLSLPDVLARLEGTHEPTIEEVAGFIELSRRVPRDAEPGQTERVRAGEVPTKAEAERALIVVEPEHPPSRGRRLPNTSPGPTAAVVL
jgi:hypothetical protein